MSFGYLPRGLGATTDFAYRFQRVDFVARVWESRIPEGWTVDLDVDVMRGRRLMSGPALHDWFISYDQRPPAEAHYVATRVNGHPGWRCQDQVFWLVHPGLAISVQLNRDRWTTRQVMGIANSARELVSERPGILGSWSPSRPSGTWSGPRTWPTRGMPSR